MFTVDPMGIKSTFDFKGFSIENVWQEVWSLLTRTSKRIDQILYWLLKQLALQLLYRLLTIFFNSSLRLRLAPEQLKAAGRIDVQVRANYRPVSITSCEALTMEKLLNGQVF